MARVRFFPEINEALGKLKDFLIAIEKYKEKAGELKYQRISESLWEKRFKPEESVNTHLDLLADVTSNYGLLGHYRDEIKKHCPVMVYAELLHDILRYLKEDVALYQNAIFSPEEKNSQEGKLTQDEFEALKKEKQLCDELNGLIERIETDFSELEHVKNVLDPIDVVIEETNSTTNKI